MELRVQAPVSLRAGSDDDAFLTFEPFEFISPDWTIGNLFYLQQKRRRSEAGRTLKLRPKCTKAVLQGEYQEELEYCEAVEIAPKGKINLFAFDRSVWLTTVITRINFLCDAKTIHIHFREGQHSLDFQATHVERLESLLLPLTSQSSPSEHCTSRIRSFLLDVYATYIVPALKRLPSFPTSYTHFLINQVKANSLDAAVKESVKIGEILEDSGFITLDDDLRDWCGTVCPKDEIRMDIDIRDEEEVDELMSSPMHEKHPGLPSLRFSPTLFSPTTSPTLPIGSPFKLRKDDLLLVDSRCAQLCPPEIDWDALEMDTADKRLVQVAEARIVRHLNHVRYLESLLQEHLDKQAECLRVPHSPKYAEAGTSPLKSDFIVAEDTQWTTAASTEDHRTRKTRKTPPELASKKKALQAKDPGGYRAAFSPGGKKARASRAKKTGKRRPKLPKVSKRHPHTVLREKDLNRISNQGKSGERLPLGTKSSKAVAVGQNKHHDKHSEDHGYETDSPLTTIAFLRSLSYPGKDQRSQNIPVPMGIFGSTQKRAEQARGRTLSRSCDEAFTDTGGPSSDDFKLDSPYSAPKSALLPAVRLPLRREQSSPDLTVSFEDMLHEEEQLDDRVHDIGVGYDDEDDDDTTTSEEEEDTFDWQSDGAMTLGILSDDEEEEDEMEEVDFRYRASSVEPEGTDEDDGKEQEAQASSDDYDMRFGQFLASVTSSTQPLLFNSASEEPIDEEDASLQSDSDEEREVYEQLVSRPAIVEKTEPELRIHSKPHSAAESEAEDAQPMAQPLEDTEFMENMLIVLKSLDPIAFAYAKDRERGAGITESVEEMSADDGDRLLEEGLSIVRPACSPTGNASRSDVTSDAAGIETFDSMTDRPRGRSIDAAVESMNLSRKRKREDEEDVEVRAGRAWSSEVREAA